MLKRLLVPKSRDKSVQRSSFIRGPAFGPAGVPYIDKSNPQARITFMLGFFVVAFSTLAMRAVDLTVIKADYLQQKVRSQYKKKITMVASRGRILDRNGRTLAISLPMSALSVDVDQMEDRDRLANNLAPIINMPVEDLRLRLRSFKAGSYPTIRHQLTPEMTRKVRNLDHHALFFFPESRRFYTMGEITSHVLGFVNFEGRGREGMERYFEDDLHGINGAQVISHDRLGRPMPMVKTLTEPHPGADIETTLDTTIQYIAYRALLKGVQKSQAKAGMAVVMNPNNGEILAMVNQPSFNPNNLAHSKSNDRRNRVVTDLFEPGSTFKVFTVSAAMDKGTVNPDTVIDVEFGKTRVADRVITDFHRGARYLTVSQVLQRSSNVGAAKIGLGLGLEAQEHYLRQYGFGSRSGIELPGDPSGSIPDVTHYRKIGLASRSFGYGITTTPLHITSAFASAINGGIYYPPTLIKGKIVDGLVVPMHKAQPHRVISEETSKRMRKILQSVVTDEGTAIEAAVEGYQVGGKTGTARKAIPGQGYVRGRYYASFVGFIPVEKPKVVIFVSIDEPVGSIYGGKVAAPVFREIAQEILPRLLIFPDSHIDPPLPELVEATPATPVPTPAAVPGSTHAAAPGQTPGSPPSPDPLENLSLGQALEALKQKGIVPLVRGSGIVKSLETPAEGPPRLIMQ
ncbi:MAG: penicillin-binding protein 2 [Magnetococcales bacterium]|nr:penicillin-binding protein 2 [Magnetococcales bacterium]